MVQLEMAGPAGTIIIEGENRQIDPEWIAEAISAHERDDFESVVFPPLRTDANLDRGIEHVVGRLTRPARGRCVYIARR